MPRTLLPVFANTCYGIREERKEDFRFLTDPHDYEAFRAALDSVPGSRDYLMNKSEGSSFYDEIGKKILSRAGDHHSGASVVGLAWTYKSLLNDWNGWVENAKIYQLKKAYKDKQLERPQTWAFAHAMDYKNTILKYYTDYQDRVAEADKKILGIVEVIKADLSLPYSNEVIINMMNELVSEFKKNAFEAAEAEAKEHFEALLEVLENHDKYPRRWDDAGEGSLTSGLFGSIYNITPAMYEVMEKRSPGFKERIMFVIAESKIEPNRLP